MVVIYQISIFCYEFFETFLNTQIRIKTFNLFNQSEAEFKEIVPRVHLKIHQCFKI